MCSLLLADCLARSRNTNPQKSQNATVRKKPPPLVIKKGREDRILKDRWWKRLRNQQHLKQSLNNQLSSNRCAVAKERCLRLTLKLKWLKSMFFKMESP